MRTFKSLLAAVLAVVMLFCMSISSFAAVYDEVTYDDINEMFNTTLDGVYSRYVKFVDLLGIVPSMGNSFDPGASLSRIQALKIAYRMLHYNYDELSLYRNMGTGFDEKGEEGDINDVSTLKPYLAWAEDYQLINSKFVPAKKFEAEKPITGEEFITLIAKVAGFGDNQNGDANAYDMFVSTILDGTPVDTEATSITREAAAVIVARAMLYDPSVEAVDEDMMLYFENYDGGRLDCLATKIYGCNSTELVVRATKSSPMSYEGVTEDVLLSNGVQADIGADLSAFIGYPITVVYLDKDASDTFTQDEELITYEFGTPLVNTMNLSQLSVFAYTSVTGAGADGNFSLYTGSNLYLNGELWPDNEAYKLNKLVNFTTFPNGDAVLNRPNLEFKFIQHGVVDIANFVLATEWIPGKIMAVNNNYISVYSYYDSEVYLFDDDDVNMSGIANPKGGDIVNFYIKGDKLYLTTGKTITFDKIELESDNSIENGGIYYIPHQFLNKNRNEFSDTVVLDITGTTYIAFEEASALKEATVEILSEPVASGADVTVEFRNLETNEIKTIVLPMARINTKKGSINAGDLFTYTESKAGVAALYGIDPVELTVIETEDYFVTKAGKKYLKADGYVGGEELIAGKATLMIDRFGAVWSVA